MKAMIMAAGLGTRLRPLTNDRPKALVEYHDKTLLEHVLTKLIDSGFKKIIINVHHFGGQVIDFINDFNARGSEIFISDERDELLDTGGALKKASKYFENEPVLVHNVDILSNVQLDKFIEYYRQSNAEALLMVKDRNTSRLLIFDSLLQLCGWNNVNTGEKIIQREWDSPVKLAFSGIYILSPSFMDKLPEKKVFPIMPEILRLAASERIIGYRHDEDEWRDMGKLESYE